MEFFKKLSQIGNIDLTLRIFQKTDSLTIQVSPGIKSNIAPLIVSGTPEELDESFLSHIMPQVVEIKGIVTNIEQVKEAAKKEVAKETSKKESSKTSKDERAKASKKEDAKIVEPNLFDDDEEGEEND